MKQKIINKVYLVSIIRNSKVIEILVGKVLKDLQFTAKTKYRECQTQIMEYNDEHNIYIPNIKEHLMMIRRRISDHFS